MPRFNLPIGLRWIVLAVVTVWIGGGIMFQSPTSGSRDPLEAAIPRADLTTDYRTLRVVEGPSGLIGCLRSCWFAGSSASKIVVYKEADRATQQTPVGVANQYLYSVLGQYGTDWYQIHGVSSSRTLPDKDNPIPQAFPMTMPEGMSRTHRWGVLQDYLIMVEFVDESQVAMVEVEYDTGQVTRDIPENGVFVSMAQATAVCEVRARGYDGEIIDTLTYENGAAFHDQNRARARENC